jgi:hypothetical protein
MFTLFICTIILLPQGIAALRRAGPATHLSLLLLSICAGTAFLTALAIRALPSATPQEAEVYYIVQMSPLGFAAMGLCLLTPLYWAIDHFLPKADYRIDAVLAQGLALTFAGSLTASNGTPFRLIETGAVVLVAIMLARGSWCLLRLRTQN